MDAGRLHAEERRLEEGLGAAETLDVVDRAVNSVDVISERPAAAFHGLDGERIPVSLDLEWESRGPAFPYAMTTRYEISSWVTGTVTIGDETFPLDKPFMVMATQNPIEQEGTYPLPEAQQDRFMFKVFVRYPNFNEEFEIARRTTTTQDLFDPEQVAVRSETRNSDTAKNSRLSPSIHHGAVPQARSMTFLLEVTLGHHARIRSTRTPP